MEIDLCCSYVADESWVVFDIITSLPLLDLNEVEDSMNHAFKEVCKIVLD